MTDPRWQRIVDEWRRNRRLRIGALAVMLALGAHAAFALSDARAAREAAYVRDAELLGRLEEASRESAWPARAASAERALAAARRSIPAARSDGLAQAEMQAWLTDLAAYAGLPQPAVRVETSLAVPGQPGLWQVLARMDATAAPAALPVVARALASAMPWVRTERLDVSGVDDYRVSVVVRGYFRAAEAGDDKAPPPRPGNIPAAGHAAPVVGDVALPADGQAVGASQAAPAGAAAVPNAARPAAGRPPRNGAPTDAIPSSQRYPGLSSEQRKALNPRRRKNKTGGE